MSLIDLHTHTNFSDGTWSVTELVDQASQRRVKLLALTDHDTFGGVAQFKKLCRAKGLAAIAGTEISVDYLSLNLHLLVYEPRQHLAAFHNYLKEQRRNRQAAAKEVIKQMRAAGFTLSQEKTDELLTKETVGKPHLAKAFLDEPLNRALLLNQYSFNSTQSTISDFIQKFLDQPGQVGYIKRPKVEATAAIKLMHSCAATVSLAHPDISLPANQRPQILKVLIRAGLDGIETVRPNIAPELQKIFINWTKRYRLLSTAGSDIHGELHGGGEVGMEVDSVTYQRLKRRLLK